jgi:ABC-2 type transport system permease protein
MQLKDKLDLGFIKDKAQLIRKIVFFVLRFIIVAGIAYVLFYVSSFLRIFHNSPFIPTSVMTMLLTIMLVISTFACTSELIKSLYMAEDNQVLVTYPISANRIFLSKIIVFYLYEVYKNFTFSLPIFIAYGMISPVNWFFYIWVFISFFVVSMIPVVLGVVLSIPGFFITRFFAHYQILKIIVFIAILSGFIYLLVRLILLIPAEINILHYWGPIKVLLSDVTNVFQNYFKAVYYVVIMVVGKYDITMKYTYLNNEVWLVLLCLVGILAALFMAAYFLARFIFVKMTSTSFEYEKRFRLKALLNRRLPTFLSFVRKEIRLLFRTGQFTANFIATYISIPLFILLINQIFSSMDLYPNGQFAVQAFNILIIMLPLLASNSTIATIYSKEGRTAYMKRTKPVEIVFPLFAKLIPNIVFSVASLLASLYIFNAHMHYLSSNIILLAVALVLIQVGHILFCALLDLMNPQNEQYATAGEQISNPNEIKATVFAFITSFLVALITLGLLVEEQFMPYQSFNYAFLKILLLSAAFFGVAIYMFVAKIKAYYYDRIN